MRPRRPRSPALSARLPATPWAWLLAGALALCLWAGAAAAQTAATPAPADQPAVPPAAAPAAAPAAEAPPPAETPAEPSSLGQRVWQAAWDSLAGQSVVLGGGYTQGTLKLPKFRNDPNAKPEISDNGRITLLLQYESPESYFYQVPLQSGQAAFGYNFVASYAGIKVDRQLHGNAFQGEALGSSLQGDYAVAAPLVFMRIGPLYPQRRIFWKVGLGVGLGLVRFHGQVLPYGGDLGDTAQAVDSHGTVAALFNTVIWELEVERWLVAFKSQYLGGKADTDRFTYEVYSLSLGYRLRF